MDTLVLATPWDIQVFDPQHAALILQQTTNLSMDNQEPPKHSGPQDKGKQRHPHSWDTGAVAKAGSRGNGEVLGGHV